MLVRPYIGVAVVVVLSADSLPVGADTVVAHLVEAAVHKMVVEWDSADTVAVVALGNHKEAGMVDLAVAGSSC